MTIDPLLNAPISVQLHVIAALTALILTPIQLLRPVGGRWHRARGYVWVCAMVATALSSFWILEIRLIGPFSPIHVLSVWVLYAVYASIAAARRGRITAHRKWLQNCAFWGLGVAGGFTLLPGRTMSEVLFAQTPLLGVAVAFGVLAGGTVLIRVLQGTPRYAASLRTR